MNEPFASAMQLLLGDRPSLDDVLRAAGLLDAANVAWSQFEAAAMAEPEAAS